MLEDLNAELDAVVADRKVILAVDAAAGATASAARLVAAGASVLVVASVAGVGDLPDAPIVYLPDEDPSGTVMEALRRFLGRLERPPADVRHEIEVFDPEARAWVYLPPFATLQRALGRRVWGARRHIWSGLESKIDIDALWDECGVRRSPVEVVPVAEGAEAATRLDHGQGTVWAADNRHGWHGGGDYTRWVTPDAVSSFIEWFGPRAHRIRVMPFLDGIPCSIHGFVTPAGVAAFRPVEMVILRDVERSQFVYAGVSSTWDPPADDREGMRRAARAVGTLLRDRVDYRGPFSIDGVMTSEGFRPTELNPRLSAGFALLARAVDGLEVGALVRSYIDGHVEVDAAWLEDVVVASADASRSGGMGLPSTTAISEPAELRVQFADGEIRAVMAGGTASLEIGHSVQGSYVRLSLDAQHHPAGPSVAPQAALAARFAAQKWNLDIPPVSAAPDVKRS